MKKILLLLSIIIASNSCKMNTGFNDQNTYNEESPNEIKKTQVLTLGSFHFNFPNLDVKKVTEDDQIDVLDPQYQKEIELIVSKLEKFKPTKIVIERRPELQKRFDSLYNSYLQGIHTLSRSEEQQIGFRLAKRLGLKTLYCTDAWGEDYQDVKQLFADKDSIPRQKFLDFFYHNPDSLLTKSQNDKPLYKTKGILAALKQYNDRDDLRESLGSYLTGIFKYEIPENHQFGVDFTTGWWFNRNLRIFRNIQRINATPQDRVLVIYGAGHMNLLNVFFEASPEYDLLYVNDYLN